MPIFTLVYSKFNYRNSPYDSLLIAGYLYIIQSVSQTGLGYVRPEFRDIGLLINIYLHPLTQQQA